MSDLRELTDAELDTVCGAALMRNPNPQQPIVKLLEEVLVDILRFLEPKQPVRAKLAQD